VLENRHERRRSHGAPLLAPRSSVIKLERLRHGAGEPFALETCYLRAAEFPDLLSAPLARESLFAFLERKYKVEIGYADEEIDATAADHRIADLLAILTASLCSAFVRSSIPPQAKRSCTFWALPI